MQLVTYKIDIRYFVRQSCYFRGLLSHTTGIVNESSFIYFFNRFFSQLINNVTDIQVNERQKITCQYISVH